MLFPIANSHATHTLYTWAASFKVQLCIEYVFHGYDSLIDFFMWLRSKIIVSGVSGPIVGLSLLGGDGGELMEFVFALDSIINKIMNVLVIN